MPARNRLPRTVGSHVLAGIIAVALALMLGACEANIQGDGQQTPSNDTAATGDRVQAQDAEGDSNASKGFADDGQSTPQNATDPQDTAANSEDQDTTNASETSTDAQIDQSDSDDVIRADHYAFKLPAYWRGRVNVTVNGDDVTIAPVGVSRTVETDSVHYEVSLATITLVSDTANDEVVVGDIGNHLMYQEAIDAGRIELWTSNWPWIAASGTFPATKLTTEELETLVNLSTGGSLTYEDALRLGAGSEEVMYAESCYSEIVFES